MRLPAFLTLLLACAVVAGAVWHFLGSPTDTFEAEADDPVAIPATGAREEVAPAAGLAVVELPVGGGPAATRIERVGVLSASDPLPEPGMLDPKTQRRLDETMLRGDLGALRGTDLVRHVADAAYLRASSEADLDALHRLPPDPDWDVDAVPLVEVLEYWRREGFEVECRGEYVLVTLRGP